MKVVLAILGLFLRLAASLSQCNSQSDEVQLLQVSSGQEQIPGLDKIVNSVSKTLGATKELANEGIGNITGQLTAALDKADLEIQTATHKFNKSVHEFYASANMVDTVAQNFTRLQKLVSDTVDDLIPCYTATLDNVKGAVAATTTILSSMGQKDLLEKLEDCQGTAAEKFSELADAAEEMARTMENSASSKVNEAIDFMGSKTQLAVDITKDFRAQFDDQIAAFGASLSPKLALALGDAAVKQVSGLTSTADKVFGNLEKLLKMVNVKLPKCGETVDYQLQLNKQEGFWAHIFHGIFGR